jgi:hypothetical protein
LVFQGEGAFSPNKPGIPEFEVDPNKINFPFDVKRSPYYSYAIGFNYFIPLNRILKEHEGDTVLTTEWSQSRYLDSSIPNGFMSNMLVTRIQDGFLSNQLKISMSVIIESVIESESRSFVLWPKAGWDFQNGLVAELSYVKIMGNGDSLLKIFNDKSIIIWRIQYEY